MNLPIPAILSYHPDKKKNKIKKIRLAWLILIKVTGNV